MNHKPYLFFNQFGKYMGIPISPPCADAESDFQAKPYLFYDHTYFSPHLRDLTRFPHVGYMQNVNKTNIKHPF